MLPYKFRDFCKLNSVMKFTFNPSFWFTRSELPDLFVASLATAVTQTEESDIAKYHD